MNNKPQLLRADTVYDSPYTTRERSWGWVWVTVWVDKCTIHTSCRKKIALLGPVQVRKRGGRANSSDICPYFHPDSLPSIKWQKAIIWGDFSPWVALFRKSFENGSRRGFSQVALSVILTSGWHLIQNVWPSIAKVKISNSPPIFIEKLQTLEELTTYHYIFINSCAKTVLNIWMGNFLQIIN